MIKTPFILVTGFLGSGKTTFLKNVLSKMRDRNFAVVQNEFAPGNIDGTELKNEVGDFQLLEINNGSAFCVCLLGSFIASLSKFVDECQPEMVFMEASGLSDPIAIAQILDDLSLKDRLYLSGVWTIVDCSAFLKYQQMMTRARHQIRVADVVVLNKTDLSTDGEMHQIERNIKNLNPFCQIIKSQFCNLPNSFLDMNLQSEVIAQKVTGRNYGIESSGRPDINVGVLRTTKTISRVELLNFVDNYSKSTIRMKGFIKLNDGDCLALQSSYGRFDFREIANYSGPTEIIAMGEGFNLSEFSRKYRALAE